MFFFFIAIQLSVIIRDPNEKLNRSGINCIRYESSHASQHLDRIFTAGRDSIIRSYTNLLDDSKNVAHQLSCASHTDWVNDIVLCPNTKTLFSASSDSTVKLWNASNGTLLSTLCNHKDYVKCLAFAKDKSLLASAGFDKNIFIGKRYCYKCLTKNCQRNNIRPCLWSRPRILLEH